MRKMTIAIGLCLSLVNCAYAVDSAQCSAAKTKVAEKVVSTLKDWDAIFEAFKEYGSCDDGAIGEGFSDSVGRLLAFHWNTIDRLAKLTNKNRKFSTFVIKHVDETLMPDVLLKIRENAVTYCPKVDKKICMRIEIAASKSLSMHNK